MDALDQAAIDRVLIDADGTPNKGKLGANAILGVSMAVARAAADTVGLPLWRYLGGASRARPADADDEHPERRRARRQRPRDPGVHDRPAGRADLRRGAPRRAPRSSTRSRRASRRTGSPPPSATRAASRRASRSNEAAIQHILEAIEAAGYKPGEDVALALDGAMSEFYDPKSETYTFDRQRAHARGAGRDLRGARATKYPIVSIEDGLAENDATGWKLLTDKLGKKVQLVGDDIFVTNPARLAQGMDEGVANAILIKLNQIGTRHRDARLHPDARRRAATAPSSRTARARRRTRSSPTSRWRRTRGRSRRARSPRSDRVAKYNQLLRIGWALGEGAVYAGKAPYTEAVAPRRLHARPRPRPRLSSSRSRSRSFSGAPGSSASASARTSAGTKTTDEDDGRAPV